MEATSKCVVRRELLESGRREVPHRRDKGLAGRRSGAVKLYWRWSLSQHIADKDQRQ